MIKEIGPGRFLFKVPRKDFFLLKDKVDQIGASCSICEKRTDFFYVFCQFYLKDSFSIRQQNITFRFVCGECGDPINKACLKAIEKGEKKK